MSSEHYMLTPVEQRKQHTRAHWTLEKFHYMYTTLYLMIKSH